MNERHTETATLSCPLGAFVRRRDRDMFDFRASVPCGHLIRTVVEHACRLFPDGAVALNYGEFAVQYHAAVQVFKGRRATPRCRHSPAHVGLRRLHTGLLCIEQSAACFHFAPGPPMPLRVHLADLDDYLRQVLRCASYQAKLRCHKPEYISLQLAARSPQSSTELDVQLAA